MFPELYFSFGTDEKAYKDYYMNNAGYFMPRPGRVSFLLDEDARSLGISNHDIRLLDEAIRLLEEGLKQINLAYFSRNPEDGSF